MKLEKVKALAIVALCIVTSMSALYFNEKPVSAIITVGDEAITTTESSFTLNFEDDWISTLNISIDGMEINGSYSEYDNYIHNSNGNYYPAIGSNIQVASDDAGSAGWVEIPNGTFQISNINIIEPIIIRGAGMSSTILNFTGSGVVFNFVANATGGRIDGCGLRDLRINAHNNTAVRLSATTPYVIHKGDFENLQLVNVSCGIHIEGGTTATEVYANTFRNIRIDDANVYGIYERNATFNHFDDIHIVAGGSEEHGGNSYAIHTTGLNSRFTNVETSNCIYAGGQNARWDMVTIEDIDSENTPINYAFWVAGQSNVLTDIVIQDVNDSDCEYGFVVGGENTTIVGLRGFGAVYPDYLFQVQSASSGVAINIHGTSTFWTHLNRLTNWSFINVNGFNSLFPYYAQATPPTLLENTSSYWYNTTSEWGYMVCNMYGTQYYWNGSLTP